MAVKKGHKRQERRLPVQQLMVLALARVGEPIAFTSIFPYLPEMIESLNVPPDQVAKWAGITVSTFPLAQTMTAILWGRASDIYGRKPILLLGLTSTMITSILWGFSRSIYMAIIVRALAGAGNGNVGIIRTSVAEMVPWKELQPRAFSIMPLVWNVGSIFGPTLGGALANPLGITPGEPLPSNPSFFERFPYALPNLVSAVIFAFGICTGFLFLEETLEVKRNQRDYGLILGDRIKVVAKMCVWKTKRFFTRKSDDQVEEHEPLLKSTQSVGSATLDEETGQSTTTPKETPPPPSLKEVLHYQTVMNLIVYTLLALHNMTFDQLIPIFMHYPEQDRSSHNPDFKPPFKFSSGFGLNSGRIGFLFTLYGVWCMLVQFFLFPPIARRFGVLPCMRVCAVIMPLTYIVTPFTSLIRDPNTQQAAIFLCMITKGVCTTFAFPCSTILLTNSAASLRILGTLNGLATLFGAVGRAIGPAIGGAVFTLGVQNGFIIAPFWILAAIGAIAAVPTFYLEEGEGFGGSNDDVEDSDDEIESPNKSQAREIVGEEAEEEGYGGVGPLLSRTNTASSRAMSMDYEGDYAYEDASRREVEGQSSGPLRRKTSRQMSTPIGMKKPIGPKFSSSLGQSFGSAGSYGV